VRLGRKRPWRVGREAWRWRVGREAGSAAEQELHHHMEHAHPSIDRSHHSPGSACASMCKFISNWECSSSSRHAAAPVTCVVGYPQTLSVNTDSAIGA
jgi:hypothetical protein